MNTQKRNMKKGFTLVEVMAVLLIIGLLAGVAVKNFMGQIGSAKIIQTKASLKNLHEAVQMFWMDTGRYPSDDMRLIELVEQPVDADGWRTGGYLDSVQLPKDAWKRDFDYRLDPGNGKPFVVISYGADGEEEGEGDNADLWSTDAN